MQIPESRQLSEKIRELEQQLNSSAREIATAAKPIIANDKINNLIVVGIPERENDDPKEGIKELARKLECELTIFQARRLGSATTKKLPRPILVEFSNSWERRKMYASRSKLVKNQEMKNIYINEDLMKQQAELYFLTRQAKKLGMISKTWTMSGNVYITSRESPEKAVQVNNEKDIRELLPLLPQFPRASQR